MTRLFFCHKNFTLEICKLTICPYNCLKFNNTTMKTINIHSHLLPGHSIENDQIVELFTDQFIGENYHYRGSVNFPDDCPNLTDIHIYNIKVMKGGYGRYVWILDVHYYFGKNCIEKDYTISNNYSEIYDAFISEEFGSEESNKMIIDAFGCIMLRNIGTIVEDVMEVEDEIQEFNHDNQ